nr:uncharacterized protein LOC127340188 [Lolium perenne]
MENGEGYAQTVLPAAELADKAGEDTSIVADVLGARRPEHAGLGSEALATPKMTRTAPPCGPASPLEATSSTRPAMHGSGISMTTLVNQSTSIKTVENHKGLATNKILDFGGIEKETSQNVRSSGRLRAQPNYDATQLERAKMLLQKRDELPVIVF